MENRDVIDRIVKRYGFNDYKWIVPRESIFVSSWVRFRCQFGCKNYGKKGSCPPAVPSVEECRQMIHEYEHAIIFHFQTSAENDGDKHKLMSALYELEREVFLAGCYRVFLLQYGSCVYCKDCSAGDTRTKCVNKIKSRPGADAMGIDVYKTAHNAGYQVQVVRDYDEITNRFAFLLVD